MWTFEEFISRCSKNDVDGRFYPSDICRGNQDKLEMMCLGTIDIFEWRDIGCDEAPFDGPLRVPYQKILREVYFEPYAALWEQAGVPESWWDYPSIISEGLTYAELVHAYEIMSGYAEAIESGVPLEDILA